MEGLKMEIAIIILTHNNLTSKHGSLESLLISLSIQNIDISEIVIVDNCSNSANIKWLKLLEKKCLRVNFIYLNTNNIALGRNIGIKETRAQNLIFIDDDTILFKKDTLYELIKYTSGGLYGYSANRLWTSNNWYEKHKSIFDEKLKNNETDFLKSICSLPSPKLRNKKNMRHLSRTYIGNFGFAKRIILDQIGGWNENFIGYGAEDDLMAIDLFLKFGKPILLSNIEVIHISHLLNEINYNELNANREKLSEILKTKGIKEFHTGRLMYDEDDVYKLI
jgi:glycosyltransferase involved in cell wall biosynthesis